MEVAGAIVTGANSTLLRATVGLATAPEVSCCDDCGSMGNVAGESPADGDTTGFGPSEDVACAGFRSSDFAGNGLGEDAIGLEGVVAAALDVLFRLLDFSMGGDGFAEDAIELPETELAATSGNFVFCDVLVETA